MNLEALWASAEPGTEPFGGSQNEPFAAVRLYLDHAVATGTILANAVRLRMHGEIKLKGWADFTADQVIVPERGMIWSASTTLRGLPVRGADCFADGKGSSRWRLFGLIPVANMVGFDVDRAAAARMAAELVWLPSYLSHRPVEWRETAPLAIEAKIVLSGFETNVALTLSPDGGVQTITLQRWGNPNGLPLGFYPFGGVVEAETTFDGNTIPSKLRVGWHFGTDRFEIDGEFFRATVDSAQYR